MRRRATSLMIVGIIVALAWSFAPIYWAIINSIKLPKDVFDLSFIPFFQFKVTANHWIMEFTRGRGELVHALKNSLVVAVTSSFLVLTLGTMAGYGLARFKFSRPGNQDIAVWFLSQRVLPPVAIVIPLFLIMKTLHLLDSPVALIIAHTTFNLPLGVLVSFSMFREIPIELEEAAWVDGLSRFGTFLKIALPLVVPGLIAVFIISFAFSWNEFLFALTFTYRKSITMPVLISGMAHSRGVQFWFVATRSLLAIAPPLFVVLFVQRYLVRGLTMGGVKG